MAAALTRSTVTGDSRMRCGVRVADTTTSWPKDDAGKKSTCTVEAASLTVTSWVSKPTELITSVTGSLGTFNLKLPLSSVKVPCDEPFTVMETAGTFSAFDLLRTLPDNVTACEKAAIEKIIEPKRANEKRMLFFINN